MNETKAELEEELKEVEKEMLEHSYHLGLLFQRKQRIESRIHFKRYRKEDSKKLKSVRKCECDPLEKLIATNFPYFRCPKCGEEYISSGRAKVIDKTDLGSIEERKQKGLKY
jgi:predicted RNA-binding Zn-ribbon protein involved in translation (DUF1610 family)